MQDADDTVSVTKLALPARAQLTSLPAAWLAWPCGHLSAVPPALGKGARGRSHVHGAPCLRDAQIALRPLLPEFSAPFLLLGNSKLTP